MRLKLSAMMLLSIAFLVFTAGTAPAAINEVLVGGTSIAALTGTEYGPGWSWDGSFSPRILLLNSSYTHEIIAISCTPPSCAAADRVDIQFSGNVSITATGATNAIYSPGIIDISGVGGTLTVTSTNAPAIYTGGNLTFSGGKITASAINGVAIYSGGDMTLTGDAYVTIKRPSGLSTEYSLFIPPGSTLTIDSNATLVNLEGTINNRGTINNEGTIKTVTDIEIDGGVISGTGVVLKIGGGGGGGGCNVSGGGYDVSVLFCILALAALGMFRWARWRK